MMKVRVILSKKSIITSDLSEKREELKTLIKNKNHVFFYFISVAL